MRKHGGLSRKIGTLVVGSKGWVGAVRAAGTVGRAIEAGAVINGD